MYIRTSVWENWVYLWTLLFWHIFDSCFFPLQFRLTVHRTFQQTCHLIFARKCFRPWIVSKDLTDCNKVPRPLKFIIHSFFILNRRQNFEAKECFKFLQKISPLKISALLMFMISVSICRSLLIFYYFLLCSSGTNSPSFLFLPSRAENIDYSFLFWLIPK
jgi:hypothetical protein